MTGRLYFFNVGPFLPTKQIKIFCFINWKMTILCNNMLKFIKNSIGRDPAVSCGILRYPAVIRPTPLTNEFTALLSQSSMSGSYQLDLTWLHVWSKAQTVLKQ